MDDAGWLDELRLKLKTDFIEYEVLCCGCGGAVCGILAECCLDC